MSKCTSMRTMHDPAAGENICWGQTPACQWLSMLCLHFSGESRLAGRLIKSPVLQMHYTHKNTHMAVTSVCVLPVPPVLVLSLYCRKKQLPWIHTRRKHRISTLSCTQWTNSGASDLLTWTEQGTACDCFLSHYLASDCSRDEQEGNLYLYISIIYLFKQVIYQFPYAKWFWHKSEVGDA